MAERGYRRSWLQCQRKIKSLRAKYKEVKDWNKRSGRQRITCPFYEELDRILGDKPSVQPLELLDSCFVQEEPEEESPGPAAVAASVASRSFGDTGDGTLLALSPSASTCDESSTASEDTSVNSHASSTPTASTTARSRKRKSKMVATLEVFADKITSALKDDDTDLLLKMQAAQHEHDSKMFAMISQFMGFLPSTNSAISDLQLNSSSYSSFHKVSCGFLSISHPAPALLSRFKSTTALQ
ncbi:uncharacterized protein [Misgurnus anguillicaudatus]|uniref:uncharacterized protein n=1 Tax=Misgurnus anguillicaudatus TaxID=75329 RepID=UPI003CCF5CEC